MLLWDLLVYCDAFWLCTLNLSVYYEYSFFQPLRHLCSDLLSDLLILDKAVEEHWKAIYTVFASLAKH